MVSLLSFNVFLSDPLLAVMIVMVVVVVVVVEGVVVVMKTCGVLVVMVFVVVVVAVGLRMVQMFLVRAFQAGFLIIVCAFQALDFSLPNGDPMVHQMARFGHVGYLGTGMVEKMIRIKVNVPTLGSYMYITGYSKKSVS